MLLCLVENQTPLLSRENHWELNQPLNTPFSLVSNSTLVQSIDRKSNEVLGKIMARPNPGFMKVLENLHRQDQFISFAKELGSHVES